VREKLLAENKFRKYLLYALGEILLIVIVIGILIALQINNWNENQKLR
jgi:competence protein ComGC